MSNDSAALFLALSERVSLILGTAKAFRELAGFALSAEESRSLLARAEECEVHAAALRRGAQMLEASEREGGVEDQRYSRA